MSFRRWVTTACLAAAFVSPLANAKFTPEQVKAVYIYRIASFVFWGADEQMNEISICAPDDEEVRDILTDITKDKLIRNKPLHISNSGCDVLYITKKESLDLIKLNPNRTISISDIQSFTELGGVVELSTLGGRIKPRVNLENVGEYTLSANFLRVAEIVGGKQ
ncbi:YfiR family protein [Vibrio sinaloensis]|uniref:YfiR family protein n=1 Tax=Photobacterium sp. (strain ATCC 43367) TaxID=379097 RepID=A0A0A5HTG3_PHOS4|nr:YfiR family protein [Vibrio sinaloensis]KGY08837.1 hypothetical protein NM06_09870 [Vibrio sinaloensis]